MTEAEAAGDYGWFQYGGREPGRQRQHDGVELPLPRHANDPPIVVWQQDDTVWVVDDDDRDAYWHIHGFTHDQIVGAIRFAWAMGWLDPRRARPAVIRRIGDPGPGQLIT